MKAAISGFTAWSNIRLVCSGCEADNILKELMEGERLKVLLQGFILNADNESTTDNA